MTQKLKVAVIGLGNIGRAVATNLVKGNRPVIIADRTFAKAKSLSETLGNLAQPSEILTAVNEADIIVLAIYFEPIKAFLKQYASELEGKIIVDPSNPIALAEGGGFKKIIGEDQSAGQILSTQLPRGTKRQKRWDHLVLPRYPLLRIKLLLMYYSTQQMIPASTQRWNN